MNLIILTGWPGQKQTGKDTIGTYFIGKGYKRIALGDQVKKQYAEFMGSNFKRVIPHALMHGSDEDKNTPTGETFADGSDMTIRTGLQWFGQLMWGTFGYDYWVKQMIVENDILATSFDYVVTDVRMEHELNCINDLLQDTFAIHTIRIKRDTGSEDKDISETGLRDKEDTYFDYIIDNNGTLDETYSQLDTLCNILD